jgi:hypothetical protein
MHPVPRLITLVCVLLFGSAGAALGHEGAFSVILENDIFTGSDNNYTNGVGISWTSDEVGRHERGGFVREWAEFWSFLPYMDPEQSRVYASWTLGQEMHTPDDILNPEPALDDQPYAGVLYVDSLLHARRGRWGHAWGLRLGVVGPASQADRTQIEMHRIFGADRPQAWDTQMPNEPIVNIGYTTGYLAAEGPIGDARWRVLPIGTVGLGNYATAVGAGVYAEAGWNLSDALAASALRSGLNANLTVAGAPQGITSVSLFAGVGGYGVAHYLPFDGTLTRDSRSVGSNPAVGFVSAGMAVRHERLAASLGITLFTEGFEGQKESLDFGTLVFAWYF